MTSSLLKGDVENLAEEVDRTMGSAEAAEMLGPLLSGLLGGDKINFRELMKGGGEDEVEKAQTLIKKIRALASESKTEETRDKGSQPLTTTAAKANSSSQPLTTATEANSSSQTFTTATEANSSSQPLTTAATLAGKKGNSLAHITPEMKFADVTEEDVPRILGKGYVTIEQSYNKLVFKVMHKKNPLKASQIMRMKRTGRAPTANVEQANKLASMLARKVIEGDVVIQSSEPINDESVGAIIARVISSAKGGSKDFVELMKDPRMADLSNMFKNSQEATKAAKKDKSMPDDVKKAIAEVRASRKP